MADAGKKDPLEVLAQLGVKDPRAEPRFADIARAPAAEEWRPGQKLYLSKYEPVEGSPDLDRVMALERRPQLDLQSARALALADMMTARWSRGPRQCACATIDPKIAAGKRKCLSHLKPVQAWALYEMGIVGGLLAHVPVGAGKTAIGLLAPLALEPLGVRHSLLLVPPNLLEQLERDYLLIREHFQVPGIYIHGLEKRYEVEGGPKLHVLPYSRLSMPTASSWIRNLQPQAIIADECDKLRDPNGAGSSRVMRYFMERGDTKFCGWTGSLTDSSISDYGHLAALALRMQSPLPLDPLVVTAWAKALDESDNPAPPGELGRFCEVDERLDATETEGVREGYRRRLAETMGVVVSTEASVDVDLVIEERPAPEIPPIIHEALFKARTLWVRPDTLVPDAGPDEVDEELVDAMQVAKVCRELASGIFYRWRFDPINGVPQRKVDIDEWKDARKDWNRELRRKLSTREEWLDSPLLCEHAAQRYHGDRPRRDDRPEWDAATWARWRSIKTKVRPTTEACRVSDYLAVDAARWALEHLGCVWYGMVEFGRWVAELSGCTMHGGGPNAGKLLAKEIGNRSIIASIKSHGRGRDGLQALYCEQLIAQIPTSATMWEQCLDSETEVLSDRGWLGIDDDWTTARAAAYSVADGSIIWTQARRVERSLNGEPIYGISNPHLDIRVTAGHRMIVERSHHASRRVVCYRPREFINADSMPLVGRIPLAGAQQAAGVPLSDAELIFLGLFMSDGNLDRSNNTISLFQSERYPEIIELIEHTIKACGFKARRSIDRRPTSFGPRSPLHRWTVSHGAPIKTDKHLRGWGELEPYVDKNFPKSLDEMTREQLLSFLRGYWAGDGDKTPGTYAYDLYDSGTLNIATCRKLAADRIQSLCVRRGMRCNITGGPRLYKLRISPEIRTWSVKTKSSDDRPVWGRLDANTSERVWCVQVPTEAIVIRRNGKAAIVGNCLGRLHRQGQDEPEVRAWYYAHTQEIREALETALGRAGYVRGTLGAEQKLLVGRH